MKTKFYIKNKRGFYTTLIIIGTTIIILLIMLVKNNIGVGFNNLAIKTGPGIQYKTVKTVNRGTRLQILSEKNNWYRVVYKNQKIGWIPTWLVNNNKITNATKLSETTIVLDPGHGGNDSGALSTHGQKEKTYTLQLAQKVANKLRNQGAHVIMTRDSDKSVSLYKRPDFSTDNHANLFVSFHFDSSSTDNTASGFTNYYYHAGKSKQLASDINSYMGNVPLNNRGVQIGNYLVIRDVSIPSVLLEMGYINNDHDFNKIKNPTYQNLVANDVLKGINRYVNKTY
ncbi:N-acetylmuramoyl-L-alanine amidase [Fructilactobacillus fructivorans]|uniref:SH3 domain-containing protein n=1 Tax=Fructilactobacillus fructivorans TaxID=1614 RepID=A0AAE6P0P3_9LACO|nr:N-acetylmuramoyl-L-alanine amidase [Fructilactobacillus fructivorans]QFX92709.1 SH3 domain-containing protein [Fructilactobacillus fructivorans]RDV65699.1 N-acetylmuramoyl-L-alanine amidase [Fructilactobacillus fructivorans]